MANAGRGGELGEESDEAGYRLKRAAVVRGMGWNAAFQLVEAVVALGTMVVMVRLVPPDEYGRFGALLGLLAVPTALSCSGLVAQALQLPDGEEPDWSEHAGVALWVQGALVALALAAAALLGRTTRYAPIAPLLRFASIGIALEAPLQLSTAMLRRELDFRRLRLLSGFSSLLSAASAIALGFAGAGAIALVVALCIAIPLPPALDLLFVRRFRPRLDFWRLPSLRRYRPALLFWGRQAGSWMMHNARETAASGVLPRTLGYEAIGLLGRSQALYQSTVGRVAAVFTDSLYPLLPRFAHVPGRLQRGVTLLVQATSLTLFPSVALLVLEGERLTRIVLGPRWTGIGPLIAPAGLAIVARSGSIIGSTVLLAANRLRATLVLDLVTLVITLATLVLPLVGVGLLPFAWASAGAQSVAALVYFAGAASLFERGWARRAIVPPLVATLAAAAVAFALDRLLGAAPPVLHLAVAGIGFGLVYLGVLRVGFAPILADLLGRLPGSERLLLALGLPLPALLETPLVEPTR